MCLQEAIEMKIKLNPLFFAIIAGVPIIVGVVELPYALFMSSTPYYFSFPFGSFWQEYALLLLFLDILLIAGTSYVAVPYLVIIKEPKVILYRLRRKKVTINLKNLERVEFLYGKLPPSRYTLALNGRAYIRDGNDVIIIAGIGQKIATEMNLPTAASCGVSSLEV